MTTTIRPADARHQIAQIDHERGEVGTELDTAYEMAAAAETDVEFNAAHEEILRLSNQLRKLVERHDALAMMA